MAQVGQVQMPSRFESQLVEQPNGDPDVSFVFEVRNGAPECREVHILATDDGHEVQGISLTKVRIQDVLERTIQLLILGAPSIGPDGSVDWPRAFPTEDDQREAVRSTRVARSARKVKITDDLLREVAGIYRAYVKDNPTQAIADHLDKSHRTAGVYVKAARDRIDPDTGKPFLGPALRGRAGEQS
jgi:hypothetical protein